MANSVKLRADQPVRRYVGIDVTRAIDTVAFGHMWNAFFGWSNLVWDLKTDPADTQKRVDANHPKLPIKRLVRTYGGATYADTCVMPQNVDGTGTDATYTDADLQASEDFMPTFMLRPSADKATSSLNDAGSGGVADLVYISSHGLHDGAMFGAYGVSIAWLFQLAVIAAGGAQFAGPGWLVLANCGTLDTSTHEDWLKVMSGPTPLRGVVGYRETCPAEEGSVEVAAVFLNRLAAGATIPNAWKAAITTKVSASSWIVLCHEDAKSDTIADWNASALKAVGAGSKILRFDDATPSGAEVVPTADPFEAFWSKGGNRVTAINMFDVANQIAAGDTTTISVKPPQGTATFTDGTAIAITIVYIRLDYPQNVDINAMFDVAGQSGIAAPTTAHTNALNKTGTGPDTWKTSIVGSPSEIVLTLKCKDFSMLKERGVPLRLQVNNGTTTFLFVRNGSVIVR